MPIGNAVEAGGTQHVALRVVALQRHRRQRGQAGHLVHGAQQDRLPDHARGRASPPAPRSGGCRYSRRSRRSRSRTRSDWPCLRPGFGSPSGSPRRIGVLRAARADRRAAVAGRSPRSRSSSPAPPARRRAPWRPAAPSRSTRRRSAPLSRSTTGRSGSSARAPRRPACSPPARAPRRCCGRSGASAPRGRRDRHRAVVVAGGAGDEHPVAVHHRPAEAGQLLEGRAGGDQFSFGHCLSLMQVQPYTSSTAIAVASPPPMHSDATPRLCPYLLQRAQQRHQDARAGRADRMAERAGAAVHVHLVVRQAELLHRRHGDHGEGLVDLVQVDVLRAPAGASRTACGWRRPARW